MCECIGFVVCVSICLCFCPFVSLSPSPSVFLIHTGKRDRENVRKWSRKEKGRVTEEETDRQRFDAICMIAGSLVCIQLEIHMQRWVSYFNMMVHVTPARTALSLHCLILNVFLFLASSLYSLFSLTLPIFSFFSLRLLINPPSLYVSMTVTCLLEHNGKHLLNN